MPRIEIANPADWIPRVCDLLAENWAETGFDFEFCPDVDAYQRLFDAGLVFSVGAFDGDEVVGYCTVCVTPHPHNPAVVVASNDGLFVAPSHRNGLTAGRIIKASEAEAARRGATRFSWHCRAGNAAGRNPDTPRLRACRCRRDERTVMGFDPLTAAIVGSVASAGLGLLQGNRAANAQEKAQKEATRNAEKQAIAADEATNRANQKKPDTAALLAAATQAGKGGASGTMLTGPSGVDPATLALGKSTLLGQ